MFHSFIRGGGGCCLTVTRAHRQTLKSSILAYPIVSKSIIHHPIMSNTIRTIYNKLQVFQHSANFANATKLVSVPLLPPPVDRVRVKNVYLGVNATDINHTAARYGVDRTKLPFDVGMESIGVIDMIGDKANCQYKLGQPVLVVDNELNCFAEYLYKPAKSLIPLPELAPQYLGAYVNGLTASIALDKVARLAPNETVLITAAAGGTGQLVVQWAKKCCGAARVVGLTSSVQKADYLRTIGADDVINYRKEVLADALQQRFPNGIDVIWETVGGETYQTLFRHLAIKGRMVIIGSTPNYQAQGFEDVVIKNLNAKLLMRSQSLHGFGLFHWSSDYAEYLRKLISMIQNGELKVQIDFGDGPSGSAGGRFVGLSQVYRAQEWLHSGKNLGKVVVQL